MQSLLILGRQPEFGLVELESLYGAKSVRPVSQQVALLDINPCNLDFDRLGGSVKFAKVLTTLPTTEWQNIQEFLVKVSPEHSQSMPEGKMHLGISVYGYKISPAKVSATGLNVKKAIHAKTGRTVRTVPNNELELQTAQVLHNKLLGSNGWELLIVRDGNQTIIAQTIKIQDIERYTLRDRGRPKRDARVGMLPPKLAQIIVNLAVGNTGAQTITPTNTCEPPAFPGAKKPLTVLDPFCGTGVVLQEAALMGFDVYGTDIEPRMIEYSQHNLQWLNDTFHLSPIEATLEVGDATTHTWQSTPVHAIACETYLGRPLSSIPSVETLDSIRHTCDQIISKFLSHIAPQLTTGTRLCLAVPAWKTTSGFAHLKTLDSLEDLGYNRIRFAHETNHGLLYYRPEQFVARELIILERK